LVSKGQVFQKKILYSNEREVTYVTACEAVHFVEENSWHNFFSVTQWATTVPNLKTWMYLDIRVSHLLQQLALEIYR